MIDTFTRWIIEFPTHTVEKAMALHSSILDWKIPWMEEPGGLQSMGSLRVGHDWATSLSLFTFMHWRRKWQPTPVFLPGESQGRGSRVGCPMGSHRVRHDWSNLAAAAATRTEKAVKKLLHEVIQSFGLSRSLRSDNGTSFTSKVIRGVSKSSGIAYYLHCALRPPSSGKVETANQFLKWAIEKITQETSLGWKEALPVALLHTCIAPKEQVGLSPYEMLCGRPFIYVNALFLDLEAQTLWF